MIVPLETARLLLRPLQQDDAPHVQERFPRWEIVQFLANVVPWPYPDDGALIYIRDIALPAMARGEEWHWTLRLKTEPDDLIGVISLMTTPDNNRGFWIAPRWQRRGLMTEAVEVVTRYWFDVLKFDVLRVYKAIANTASRRISEKTEMRLVDVVERDYVAGRLPAELWEITAAEWKARRAGTS